MRSCNFRPFQSVPANITSDKPKDHLKSTKTANMGFGDLKTDSGLSVLSTFLADRSYIEGYF